MKKSIFDQMTQIATKVRQERRKRKFEIIEKSQKPKKSNFISFFKLPSYLKEDIVLSTKWLYGGFIISLDKLRLLVDPGAELLGRISKIEDLLPINSLFISHSHIDHTAGINTALEFITLQPDKNICIIVPKTVLKQKIIGEYFLNDNRISLIEIMPKKEITFDRIKIIPVKLFHSIKDTYGFILESEKVKIGYIADTGYHDHEIIKRKFSQVDILIVNINDPIYNQHTKYHLCGIDLADILKGSKIKSCFITHIYPEDLIKSNSNKILVNYIKSETDISVRIIPSKGLTVSLA